jgi:endoribonuclease Dicer
MIKAKCFQEFFFNGLFGRLFVGSKSGAQREFLLQKETKSLWSPSKMYLLLPLEKFNTSTPEPCLINWTGVNSCASVVEILKKRSVLSAGLAETVNISPCRNSSFETECNSDNVFHFANCLVDINNLKDMVVLAVHTGKIYSVVMAVNNTSAESPFDGITDTAPPEYATFAEYFNKK